MLYVNNLFEINSNQIKSILILFWIKVFGQGYSVSRNYLLQTQWKNKMFIFKLRILMLKYKTIL